MPEIAAYYNGLPAVKPAKKFESREVAVTRISAAVSRERAEKFEVARKPKAARKRKQPKASKPRKASNVRDEVVKLLSRAGGAEGAVVCRHG